ncbi:MAG: tetratricopeptide repeat protein [Myxococcales bacterium]|nr:tetratricopeptide repeat protein [Myxococcales bacterium]
MSWFQRIKRAVLGSASSDERPDARPDARPDDDGSPVPELSLGWSRVDQGDAEGAIAVFGEIIRRAPSESAYYGRGVARCMHGQYAKAIEDLDRALELQPRFPAAICERGLAYAEQGKLRRALADYTAALTIDVAYATAYTNLGSLLCIGGQWGEAIAQLTLALRLDPADTVARRNRSSARQEHGDLAGALTDAMLLVRNGVEDEQLRERIATLAGQGVEPQGWSVSEHMWTEFVTMPPSRTVAELLTEVRAARAFFVVLERPGRGPVTASVYGRHGLREALTRLGEDIGQSLLEVRLEQLPDLFSDGQPLELSADPELAQQRCRSSGGHTVVVDGERVVGVLTLDYEPTPVESSVALFVPEPEFGGARRPSGAGDEPRSCPACEAAVESFEPVFLDDVLTDYACPRCKASPKPSWIEDRMRRDRWSRIGFLGDGDTLAQTLEEDQARLDRLGVSAEQIGGALGRLLDAAGEQYAERIEQATARFEESMREQGQRALRGEAILPLHPTLDDVEQRVQAGSLPEPSEGATVGEHQVFLRITLGYQHCPWTCLARPWSERQPSLPIVTRRVGKLVHQTARTGAAMPCHAQLHYRHADRDFLVLDRKTGQYIRGAGLMAHLVEHHRFFEGAGSPYRLDPEHAARTLGLLQGPGA